MSLTDQNIYELIPSLYRIRDSELGEPLKALIRIIAREAGVVEENISQTYDNWFIETCEEWLLPYLADLLGVHNFTPLDDPSVFSQRAFIANTLAYRRRKGTVPVLEQLARDLTGWCSRAVESFQLLAHTQYMNHVVLTKGQYAGIRNPAELEYIGTAFDPFARSADIRHIDINRGMYNIPNIGLFTWRLQSYPMKDSVPREAEGKPGCYYFNPLGKDQQLFNPPLTETTITHIAEDFNVPCPLSRFILNQELEQRRLAILNGNAVSHRFFGPRDTIRNTYPAPFKIYLNGNDQPIDPQYIVIADLENWDKPDAPREYPVYQDGGSVIMEPVTFQVAVDPVLGRLTFPTGTDIKEVLVNYCYGFSGDTGGGPYNRVESLQAEVTAGIDWRVGVCKSPVTGEGTFFTSLTDAIAEWNGLRAGKVGMISIMDNSIYEEGHPVGTPLKIRMKEGSRLIIMAGGWPERTVIENGIPKQKRLAGDWTAEDLRLVLSADVEVTGLAPKDSLSMSDLVINGLMIDGSLTVVRGNLRNLGLSHCTLVPQPKSLEVVSGNARLDISLERTICGGIALNKSSLSGLSAIASIIDNGDQLAVDAVNTPVVISGCTLFGQLAVRELKAENSIFTGLINAVRQQTGCMRFSFFPPDSRTPRRFRCQPDFELNTQIPAGTKNDRLKAEIIGWLVPSFTSGRYGDPGYAQLRRSTPDQVRKGAENESEMGAFCYLLQPQREANLRIALSEYMPVGMEYGIIFAT